MNYLPKLLTLIACLCFSSLSPALTVPSYQLNDIKALSENSFLLIGKDPYLSFTPLSAGHDNAEAKLLTLNFQLKPGSDAPDDVRMELFFKESTSQAAPYFDSNYRMSFSVPKAHLNSNTPTFTIALPDNWPSGSTQRLRLDINGCAGCNFKALSYPNLSSRHLDTENRVIITPSHVFNGLTPISPDGIDITNNDWHLNDLERKNSQLTLTGGDPFLVSQALNIDTNELGGVQIHLRATPTINKAQDFQLFYASEKHGFVEGASTSLRVDPNADNEFKFIVPLAFLSSEKPQVKNLARIRLDLDGRVNQTEASWVIEKIKLVHYSELANKTHLIPRSRITNKRQRAHGFKLVMKSLNKIGSDIGFSIAYLLLLLTTALCFWRSYNK